ncbi:hypothetical protein DFO80_10225 [Rhodobacter sp. 140A]|nr:hypothetical protein DFO80_10225 [Rhodobacter sp. 140A]
MERPMLTTLVLRSLQAPREVARFLIALDLPMSARFTALGAVMALSAALGTAAELLFSFVTKVDLGPPTNPLPMALVQGALMLYAAGAMAFFGRQFGGTGRFADALILVVWIEFLLILGQMVQILVMVFFPLVSVLGTLALIGLLFWLLTQFTAALHGFDTLFKVAFGVIAVFFGSAMLFGMLLLSFGIVPVPAPL